MDAPDRPDHAWVASAGDRFAFEYVGDEGQIDGVALSAIADAVGTPTYVYGGAHISAQYARLLASVGELPIKVCYAVKANGSLAVLRHLHRMGAGADIVSVGEMRRAMAAGIPPQDIVFSGVGKTDAELDAAVAAGVRSINVESAEEVGRLEARALALGATAPVTLRVNPDVDPKTHPYLATGLQEAKFGISMGEAAELAHTVHRSPTLRLEGLGCHIGSQIADIAPFVDSLARIRRLATELQGHSVALNHVDLGGGFGIAYGEHDRELDIAAWGRAVVASSAGLNAELMVEPGRYLTGHCGVLLTRVIGNKRGPTKRFVVVDAAMNDLLRPALYNAAHAVVPLRRPAADAQAAKVDVVGPVCESGDFLAQDRLLTPVSTGSVLAILSCGAYGMSMASNYNTRPLPAEVFVEGGRWAVTRPRQSLESILAAERLAPWTVATLGG